MRDGTFPGDRRAHRRSRFFTSSGIVARVARFGGVESDGNVVNLGAGGALIRTAPVLNAGDRVWLRVAGAEGAWTVLGEVLRTSLWGDESLSAIQFDFPRARDAGFTALLAGKRRRLPFSAGAGRREMPAHALNPQTSPEPM